jgi:hypothetical protein
MQGIHRKERENKKRKTLLTHTGLLMEGVDPPHDSSALSDSRFLEMLSSRYQCGRDARDV